MNDLYDIGVVGGGLGGLTLAIQAAKQGFSVVLFEKEQYPFHKVCGEYISKESWNFLELCGVPLSEWNLPQISKLCISDNSGEQYNFKLPLGGFGISRYKLDNTLYEIAVKLGVKVFTQTKVNDVYMRNNQFVISTDDFTSNVKVVVGSFGKRTNLDVKWKRDFIQKKPSKISNYIGVKYHLKYPQPIDTISLHNFNDGYCGISAIEDGQYCCCYLTTANNLISSGNSIERMEKELLSSNKQLAHIFSSANILYKQPLTISQISFEKKEQVINHILFVGDAAGLITPLCGNGMSMAMHAAQLALIQIKRFLQNEISRAEMEVAYTKSWQKQFAFRTATGRVVQRLFGGASTGLFLKVMNKFPFIATKLIQQTHGKPF